MFSGSRSMSAYVARGLVLTPGSYNVASWLQWTCQANFSANPRFEGVPDSFGHGNRKTSPAIARARRKHGRQESAAFHLHALLHPFDAWLEALEVVFCAA